VSVWHSFDHSTQVRNMQKSETAMNSRGLEYVVTQIVFSADGMYLAVADGDNAVYVYDIDRYIHIYNELIYYSFYVYVECL
jgi:WD40 repeat protein